MFNLNLIISHGDPLHQTREDAIAIIRDNHRAIDNETFVWAAKHGFICVLEYLTSLPSQALIDPFYSNFQSLLIAAENGHLGVVQYLVGLRPAPNQHIINYFAQAVCLAVKNGHTEVVNHFISLPKELGIHFNAYDFCALRYALLYDHPDIFSLIFKALEDRGFSTQEMMNISIKNLVKYGNFGTAYVLLNAAYPDQTDGNKQYPLGMIDALVKTDIQTVVSHYRPSRSPIDTFTQVQNALNFVLFLENILKDGLIDVSQEEALSHMIEEMKQLTKRAYNQESKHRTAGLNLLFRDVLSIKSNVDPEMPEKVLSRADYAYDRLSRKNG